MISTERPRQLLIGGHWREGQERQTFEVVEPATSRVMATAAVATPADVDQAVRAAGAAFERGSWRNAAASARAKVLYRIADLIRSSVESLATLEARNAGKPIRDARDEVLGAAQCFEYYAGAATRIFGETIPVTAPGLDFTLREPVGVVGLIVPWNFPLMIASWKVAPALAAGNAAILKPASYTPLTALELGRLALEAGLPEGVLNVVTGPGGTTGNALAGHPGVDKIAFTGETTTGVSILQQAAPNITRVSLELGGKSPNIIFADADLEKAAAGTIESVFGNAGQDCCARSRAFVARSIVEEFDQRVAAGTKRLKLGDPLDDRHADGAADLHETARTGPGIHRGRPARGRSPPDRRILARRPPSRRKLSRTGRVRPRLEPNANRPGRNFRPGAHDHPLRRRGGPDRHGQRQPLRAVRFDLDERHRSSAASGPAPSRPAY